MPTYLATWPDGIQVQWRALNWKEYLQFKRRSNECPMSVFLDIYRAVLLMGPLAELIPAGIVDFIGRQQLEESVFCGAYDPIKKQLDLSRQKLQTNFLLGAQAAIAAIFHYSMEEIEAWDGETFFLRLAQAELIAGKPIEPVDPNRKPVPLGSDSPKRPVRPLTSAQQAVRERVSRRDKK